MRKVVCNMKKMTFLVGLLCISGKGFAMENQNREWLNATSTGNILEKVRLMVKNGCDINARNEHGNTVLLIAAKAGRSDIVEYLIENRNGAVLKLVNAWKVKQSLDNTQLAYFENWLGLDIDAVGGGDTALMAAVAEGNRKIVKMLISAGANVNVGEDIYHNPLSYALKQKRTVEKRVFGCTREEAVIADLTSYLQALKEGREKNWVSPVKEHWTPKLRFDMNLWEEMIRILKKAGAREFEV